MQTGQNRHSVKRRGPGARVAAGGLANPGGHGARLAAIVVDGSGEPPPCSESWAAMDRAASAELERGSEAAPPPDAGFAGESSSSSLDALETNPWDSQIWTRAEVRFHQRDWRSRRTIIKALARRGDTALEKRASRIWGCCRVPQILMDPHGLPILQPGWCRDRLCPTCSGRRATTSRTHLLKITAGMNSVRFITLTRRSDGSPLADAVDHMDSSFRKLRQSGVWKASVKGGVAILEVTRHHKTGHWHPHLHVLVDGSFFPHAQLKKAWMEASGGSFIVDIRIVHDRAAAAGYIAKYITKGTALASWGTDEIVEFAEAMHGRRLIRTFGSCHGVKIDPKPEPLTPDGYRELCNVSLLVYAARGGMAAAIDAITTLRRVSALWRRVLPAQADEDEDEPPPSAGELEGVVVFCSDLKALMDTSPEDRRPTFILADSR